VTEAVAVQHEGSERGVALVIGNDNYKNVEKLTNAVADAEALAEVLTTAGFRVGLYGDLDLLSMSKAFTKFADDLDSQGGIGFFWYSGHAVEHASKSLLLPIDIDSESFYEATWYALDLERLLARFALRDATIIMVLDSCRNAPFAGTSLADLVSPISSWSGGSAPVPTNYRIIYATGVNESASDDPGKPHGLFAGELLPYLRKPGMRLSKAAELATKAVQDKTKFQNPHQTSRGEADIELYPVEPGAHLFDYGEEQRGKVRHRKPSATLLAMPLNPESAPRWQWPENLLMRIGVDRTQLVGVVAGTDSRSLYEALCVAEELVVQSDPGGRFGRRRWRYVGSDVLPSNDLDRSFGLIWSIVGDVTVQKIDEALRACLAHPQTSEISRSAGNAVILALEQSEEDDERNEEERVRQCLRLILERAARLKVDLNVCSWIEISRVKSGPVNEYCAAGVTLKDALAPIELELIRFGLQAQTALSREGAIVALRAIRGKLSRDLHPLCDWLCDDITEPNFLELARSRAFQIASFAGLLAGAGVRPSTREAERGAAVVAAATENPEASMILAGLPVCLPVLRALIDSPGAVRATVGLVTSNEILSVAPPWLGQMIDRSRGKRRLILRGESS
jgi:caspase domain-containing protein